MFGFLGGLYFFAGAHRNLFPKYLTMPNYRPFEYFRAIAGLFYSKQHDPKHLGSSSTALNQPLGISPLA